MYKFAGVKLPRTAYGQWKSLPAVDRNDLRKGDLLFWDTGRNHRSDNRIPSGEYVSHVSIYLGDGMMGHATSSKGVAIQRVPVGEYASRKGYTFLGARRVLANAGS